jgi:hypothetical protein
MDVRQVLADPKFRALPPAEQQKVLQRIDPNYAALDPSEQLKVLSVSAPANPPQKISTKMIDAIPGGAAEVKRRAAAGEPVVQEGLRRGGVLDEIRAGVAGAAAGAVEGIAGPVGLAIDAARYAQNGLPGAVAQMGADLAQGRFLPATQAVSRGADAVQNAIGPGEDIATSAAPAFIRTGVDLAMPGPEVALAGRGVRKVMGEGAEAAAKLADDAAPLADDAARMAENAAADAGTVPPELAGVHSGAEINLPEGAAPDPAATVPPPVDSVQKVVQALREAKPIRREQEAIYRAERGARMDTALEARAAGLTGEAGFNAEKAALGGPMEKLQFESLRSQISQQDVDALFDRVAQSDLTFWESITARRGLAKLFGEYGGHVPQKSEMALLRRVFGDELPNEMLKKRSLWAKFKDVTVEVANVPRAIMASFDLSAPFRQGAFFVGRPKRFFPAFKELLRAYGSEDAYQAVHDAIRRRPSFPLMEESGLAITDLEKAAGTAGREENFVSNLAERIPLVGRGVRASGRAHTAFLVKMRADVFDDIVKRAADLGLKPQDDPALLEHIAKYVNAGTGRGELPQVLQGSADLLNTLMFSPRLMFSRLHLLNPQTYLDPKIPALVRREAMKDALKFAAVGSSVLSMAALNGLEVGLDPRSADFGKIKMQDTRIDVWGGFQQYVRMAAQLGTGQYVSTTKPDVVKELGVGYKPQTRLGILGRQAESKLAPVASFVVDMLRGQDYRGQPIDVQQEIVTRIVPIIAQDIKALYDEDPSLIPLAALSALGFGVQTYAKPKPKEKQKKKPVADASSALEGLRQETAPLSREAGAQVAAAKAGVYVDPDGRETPIPRALMLSALRREDPTEASSPMMRWLAGMQKQKKIRSGGRVEFRVA